MRLPWFALIVWAGAVLPVIAEEPTPPVETPQSITYDDLVVKLPEGEKLRERSQLGDRQRELDGKLVVLKGYIHGGTIFRQKDIKNFVLIRYHRHGFGAQESHPCESIRVHMTESIDFTVKPLTLQGRLRVDFWTGADGDIWSIYKLEQTQLYQPPVPPPTDGSQASP